MSESTLTVCCPTPTAIESAVTVLNPCPDDIGQIQKLIFWRRGNSIASEATALIATTWNTLLAATDDTKAIISPFVGNVQLPPSESREFGGSNETQTKTYIYFCILLLSYNWILSETAGYILSDQFRFPGTRQTFRLYHRSKRPSQYLRMEGTRVDTGRLRDVGR